MDNIKNIHHVGATYFFLLSFTYITAALAFRNGIFPDVFMTLMRVMDIPLAMVALAYGGSSLILQLQTENEDGLETPWTIIIFAVCLLLFSMVVFINFSFPSVI